MSKFQVEIHRRVYDNANGQYVTVRPWPDAPDGTLELCTEASQVEFFGALSLILPKGMGRALGEALIAADDELEAA